MQGDCFYRLTVTKDRPRPGSYYFDKKVDVWHLGYFTYKDVLREVEVWYQRGADAVELEMITQQEFDDLLPRP